MSETKWFFPTTQGGEESGLNDPGIEFFRKSGSLARETIQNSGDARVDLSKPVIVTFELLQLPVASFPGVDRFREVVEQCRNYVLKSCKTEQQKDENGRKWFEKALGLLSGTHLPVLRIRDENTTGLEGGERDEDKAWVRLIKKQGSASMHGAGGGTFGIGQRAPFAFSGLRTVFYSTMTRNGKHAFTGKTILSSFRDREYVYRPIGFWGTQSEDQPGVVAVRDSDLIVEPFRRTSVGTDLYVMGFEPQGWRDAIADSVAYNFFAAIQGGGLVIRLLSDEGDLEFNSTTIEQLVDERYRVLMARATSKTSKKDVRDTLGVTRHYLKALQSPTGGKPSFSLQHPELGRVELYVTLDPEAPSRTAFMRRPRIRVYERTQNLLSGYAAVLLCEDPGGNDLLARMEDPSHSEWSRERLPGGAGRPSGDKLLADIYDFVRASLKKLAQQDSETPQDLPDLGRYLPEDDALRPGFRQTGVPVRTPHVSEQESARPQQPQGRKRALQRPRPSTTPQVLHLPVETAEQGDQGLLMELSGLVPLEKEDSSVRQVSNQVVPQGGAQVGVRMAGTGLNGAEGSGPDDGGLMEPGNGVRNNEETRTRGGEGPFGPEGEGTVPWPGPASMQGDPVAGTDAHSGHTERPLLAEGSNGTASSANTGIRRLANAQVTVRAWFSAEDRATHLLLRATRRGRATLRLTASGEDSDYEVRVASAVDVRTGARFECVGDKILDVDFEAQQGRELMLDLRPARRVAVSVEVVHGA